MKHTKKSVKKVQRSSRGAYKKTFKRGDIVGIIHTKGHTEDILTKKSIDCSDMLGTVMGVTASSRENYVVIIYSSVFNGGFALAPFHSTSLRRIK